MRNYEMELKSRVAFIKSVLAEKLIQVAKAYAPEKNENVPQKQNEKEVQKEADSPKLGL